MAYPVAPGKTDLSSSTMRYIPALYAGKLLVKFYASSVLTAITNTDYEGDIKKYGDTVYIRTTPDVTIREYVKGQTLSNEQPESSAVTLLIDKGQYWSFVTDDLDKVQSDIKGFVNAWTEDAAEQLKETIDTDVLGNIYSDVHASNTGTSAGVVSSSFNLGVGGSPVEVTKNNILDYFVDCGTVLDEQNVPETGRFMVIPPWMAGLIKKSDLKDASLSGDAKSIMRNGLLGMIDRFTLYNSNLLAGSSAGQYCLFGLKLATTFATQLTENKIQDNPNGFGMLHRGLQVYGYKVAKPEALGVLFASKG
ncbi:MAG TPA: hypothetical protein VFI02_04705 [Armatimonadota bacterium]|nr:hypothetical protein [Armatimonadota bacterium]